jgi:hypothetical protein
VTLPWTRSVGVGGRRVLAVVAMGALVAAGCAAFRRAPLDVPPGHRLVLGQVSMVGFGEPHVALDIVREDGTYQHELPVDATRSQFVITLPPGRYQVTRLRMNDSGRTFPDEMAFRLAVEFEVRDPAVYVGTLQIERIVFMRQLRVTVQDEYERTVPALRARYPELPPMIMRALMRAT